MSRKPLPADRTNPCTPPAEESLDALESASFPCNSSLCPSRVGPARVALAGHCQVEQAGSWLVKLLKIM